MTRALQERGVDATAAALAAESGVAVFRVAFAGWIAEGEERSLAELQQAVLAELRPSSHRLTPGPPHEPWSSTWTPRWSPRTQFRHR